jgi:hypothetical protein
MPKVLGRDVKYLKPTKFRDYFTISEVCREVDRHETLLRKLEREGKIPRAARVQKGKIEIRLWSPEQVVEIQAIFNARRPPGRPKNG